MKRPMIAAITALAASTGQAQALSCVRPDVARSFLEAVHSGRSNAVVHGRVSLDTGLLPRRNPLSPNDMPPRTRIPGRLEGRSLGKAGFTAEFDAPLSVDILCQGPWCGSVSPNVPQLLFVEKTGEGFVLAAEPCGQFQFPQPTPDQLKTVRFCMRGAACRPQADY